MGLLIGGFDLIRMFREGIPETWVRHKLGEYYKW